jgi:hypothetical protein
MLNTFQAELLGSCLGHTYIGAGIREGFTLTNKNATYMQSQLAEIIQSKFKATAISLMKG